MELPVPANLFVRKLASHPAVVGMDVGIGTLIKKLKKRMMN